MRVCEGCEYRLALRGVGSASTVCAGDSVVTKHCALCIVGTMRLFSCHYPCSRAIIPELEIVDSIVQPAVRTSRTNCEESAHLAVAMSWRHVI